MRTSMILRLPTSKRELKEWVSVLLDMHSKVPEGVAANINLILEIDDIESEEVKDIERLINANINIVAGAWLVTPIDPMEGIAK